MGYTHTESDSLDYDEPRPHMERLMKAPLIDFDLSLRILIPLDKHGIRTLGDLTIQTHTSLRSIYNLGAAAEKKLVTFLTSHNLTLAGK